MRALLWWMMVLGLLTGCGSAGGSYGVPTHADAAGYEAASRTTAAAPPTDAEMEVSADFAAGPMEPMPAPPPPPQVAQGGAQPGGVPGTPPTPPKPTVDVGTAGEPGAGGQPAPVAGPKLEPLLIYTARFTMAVYEATKSMDAVDQLAKDMGGYLVRRDKLSITVRVPAKQYRGALDKIGKIGDVLHREETVEDVTDQFYDLMIRIKNARAMRDRLEDLLRQAKNVEEALGVERELARVTAEIESMEGRLKRLRELVSFSTITVVFKPRPTENIDSQVRLPFRWLDDLGLQNLLNL